jgi:hypothetical protein
MKILKNNLMRNLTLIGAGAFMATLVVLPITTSAEDDEGDSRSVAVPAATYILGASDGTNAVFTLVENDGTLVLTLVEEPADFAFNEDD